MIDKGKHNVLGVLVDAVDYPASVSRIVDAARDGRGFAATALAVHGVMTGVQDPAQRHRLNELDLVTPDGQPVRWALNLLYGLGLKDRVYGPTLTLHVCATAEREGLPVFFYGSTREVLHKLENRLQERFPKLRMAGTEPSKFRQSTPEEKQQIADRIVSSGARILFVGLGCPRQEVFAYEYRTALPMPILAVGAAFDYHAGVRREPPLWVQRTGLHWMHRLAQEPRRLWKRYALTNTSFVAMLGLQAAGAWKPDPGRTVPPPQDLLYA